MAPKAFVPPENLSETEEQEFEALGTFKILGNGMLQLVAVDGKPLTGPEKKEESKESKEAKDSGFAVDVMSAMRR